jgi:hypothetical protein
VLADGGEVTAAFEPQRRHHRNFLLEQKRGKTMLLVDLLPAPARRSVKLGDNRIGLLYAHLVDPVFITVERENSRIA